MSHLVNMKNVSSSLSSITSRVSYYIYSVWSEEGDPRVSNLPMMNSGPWSVVVVICCYLYFVLVFGPHLMKDRKPFHLKEVMVVYNLLMVLVSLWMFYEGCVYLDFGLSTWGCGKNDYSSNTISTKRFLFVAWCFFFSKIVEFADTVFMILRKRFDQVSHLHVIHHSVVPLSVWMGIRFAPVGSNSWFPLLNSFVHTIMYAYFGLMAMSDSLSPDTHVLLRRFKPYLTRLQILQFCLAIIHVLVAAVAAATKQCPSDSHLPKTFFALNLGNALLFLGLFQDFYRKSYRKKGDREPSQDLLDKQKQDKHKPNHKKEKSL